MKRATPEAASQVAPEFRAEAHALLDRVLNDCPGTTCVMVVVDGDELNAASIPAALSVKRGLADSIYDKLHPEYADG